MSENPLTELLGIRYPVIQGGMAWVADAQLAAAVSEAGGLGVIAAGSMPPELLREEIRKAKEMTRRPFGVNIMMLHPDVEQLARICTEECVAAVTTGAGNPGKYIPAWKEAGIRVMPVVPSVALAVRMERAGADAVIAEGCEAGGHIGQTTTFCLLPQVADALSIPLVAAGGIADARGVRAAFALGAQGVQAGTVFICAEECSVHARYKQLIVAAGDTGTVVTGLSGGKPVRSLKSRFVRRMQELERAGAPFEELEEAALGSLRRAVLDGDLEHGSFMAGQSAGLVGDIRPAVQIVRSLAAGLDGYAMQTAGGIESMSKTVLITGASQGIGAVMAQEFAKAGYNVAVNCYNEATLQNGGVQTAEACRAQGVEAACFVADVSDFEACGRLVKEVAERFGGIDVLINNAGITRDGLAVRMSEKDFDDVIAVNMKSVFNMIRHAGALMMRKKSGSIINMASVAGVYGNRGQINYSASKAGIIGMTKTVARELGSRGITCNAIAPGIIESPMTDALPDEVLEQMRAGTSLGRFGTPQDVAQAALYLASAGYVTGQVLIVDGGMGM